MVDYQQGGAAAPGPVLPARCDDARELGDSYTGTKGQGYADSSDCAQADAQRKAGDDLKPWRTLQAECLLAGFPAALIDGDDGRPMLIVSRWAMTRSFCSVPEAEAWLARVRGARRA